MDTIQNLKNFIRHGKQARTSNSPHADPTTNLSTIHAEQQKFHPYGAPRQPQHDGGSDPNVAVHKPLPSGPESPPSGFSISGVDNHDVTPNANEAVAPAAGTHQKMHEARKGEVDQAVIERIVAEERASHGKLPRYPGLERYTLLEKMGDGAFSNVYRARDDSGQWGEVAIKVVRKYEMNNSQGQDVLHPDIKGATKTVERSNILKEVQIMRQLNHPNIVKLIDFTESKQYYFIVLELSPGGELFHQIVRLTYFSEDLSRHVIIQVAKALEYLHEDAGVVHRDIKPENLLFYPVPFIPTKNPKPKNPDEEDKEDEGEFIKGVGAGGIGVIKIADFGLSKVIWDSQTMTPCGTVGYTAPEIVKDERYSKSVDMWALGCVLYTLLCGFPPFYDESIQTLTEKVAKGQYTFLSPWWDDISAGAKDLVRHLLTVDPDERYDIKHFLEHPWIAQSEGPPSAKAPPISQPLASAPAVGANPNLAYMDDGPTGTSRRVDFRSPGAINLREVFDVGYAVHRQEEEGKRRKNFRQGYRGATTALNALDEDEQTEDDEFGVPESAPYDPRHDPGSLPAKVPKGVAAGDVAAMEQKMRNTTLSAAAQARQAAQGGNQRARQPAHDERGYGQHSAAVAAAARKQVRNKGALELSLDKATLLGRRQKKDDLGPSGLRSEMVG
ncbi:Pkinase-domain-containing protein [Eremomyces bilateralis CBS 781.70]|uniref:Pkinase-domain-containing protein n=1 Tax=Eremomyces bilateralis CBS 781.70 TaxID=1392243 RepID=A0A6G1GF14_9PEZI|nr:Pkinase-domain-containing protein [Eremomyces bilateralis CBS 781.70]KAF1816705.1 Pkinase-domain-containing protein [Eremomyces bilateralis CBS 781.70]